MSVKIYHGRRVLLSKIGEVMSAVEEQLMPKLVDRFISDLGSDFNDEKLGARKIRELVMEGGDDPHWFARYDVYSGVIYWPVGRYALFTPYGVVAMPSDPMFDEIELPHVEEYAYWNNTDHPDEMTRRQWLARRRAWEKTFKAPRLVQTLVDKDKAYEFAWKVYDRLNPREK